MQNQRKGVRRTWVAAMGALTFLVTACGEDTTPKGNDQNGATGDGDGDLATGNLADGIAGKSCQKDGDTCTGGSCASELTGGTLGRLGAALPAPNGYCSAACTQNNQCGSGGVCFGSVLGSPGECRRGCKASGDCEQGQECATTNIEVDADAGIDISQFEAPDTCQPLPPVDKLEADQAGKTCKASADCGDGTCAEASNSAGGYCTGTCAADADCGAGGVCIPGIYGSSGTCREACSKDGDCQNDAMGWGCGDVNGKSACVRKGDPLADGVVGKACTPETEETDCGSGTCREMGFSGEKYPGGYCVGRCTANSDCGADGVCIGGSSCFKGCSEATDCRSGYACTKHPLGGNSAGKVCYPKTQSGADAG
ncbi:MAG: hypothetical protein QM778_24265 [Myxococcales bacterium]